LARSAQYFASDLRAAWLEMFCIAEEVGFSTPAHSAITCAKMRADVRVAPLTVPASLPAFWVEQCRNVSISGVNCEVC
jgi:hypothetical protein